MRKNLEFGIAISDKASEQIYSRMPLASPNNHQLGVKNKTSEWRCHLKNKKPLKFPSPPVLKIKQAVNRKKLPYRKRNAMKCNLLIWSFTDSLPSLHLQRGGRVEAQHCFPRGVAVWQSVGTQRRRCFYFIYTYKIDIVYIYNHSCNINKCTVYLYISCGCLCLCSNFE